MNIYKKKDILDYVRSHGKLPTDPYGQRLSTDELMNWFGLNENLTIYERLVIKNELSAMVEAELSVEQLQQSEQLRPDAF